MCVFVDAVKTSHNKVCLHWFWALNLPSRGLVALVRFHAGWNRHSCLSKQCLEVLLACYFQAHRPGKTPPSLHLLVHQLYCCLNFPKALSCFAFFFEDVVKLTEFFVVQKEKFAPFFPEDIGRHFAKTLIEVGSFSPFFFHPALQSLGGWNFSNYSRFVFTCKVKLGKINASNILTHLSWSPAYNPKCMTCRSGAWHENVSLANESILNDSEQLQIFFLLYHNSEV